MNCTYNDPTESTAIVKLENIIKSLFLFLIALNSVDSCKEANLASKATSVTTVSS